jgi:acyl-CoA dehydrogenase
MDFTLTPEQAELRATARKFAYEELKPASYIADRNVDPVDCFSPDLVRRASELGLRTMALPREYGGVDANVLTQMLVLEELCTGDVGFGMSLQHAWREGRALATLTTDEQRERFLPGFLDDPTALTSLGMTESHFGSDGAGHSDDPADGPQTTAVRDGDEWVINGSKRWITNANISKVVFLIARTDHSVPWRQGVSLFLVPTDADGYKVGQIEDKMGIRMNPNAEIVLNDCRIPASYLVGEVNGGMAALARMGPGSKAKTGAKALGTARAAYEEALAYAQVRVQGGKPIFQHQAVGNRLAEMWADLEMVRTLIWRAAWAVDNREPDAGRLESMAKARASEIGVQVAIAALEIHGSYGIQRGGRIEKLVRDAAAILHTGTANDAIKSIVSRGLVTGEAQVAHAL